MGSTTAMTSAQVGTVISGMLGDITTYFTENIGAVLTFAVGFMVLSLLLAVGRRFFRL